eukprot:COSAG06_NODE_5036_length_3770_cov_13.868973_5_plen_57_part_00
MKREEQDRHVVIPMEQNQRPAQQRSAAQVQRDWLVGLAVATATRVEETATCLVPNE